MKSAISGAQQESDDHQPRAQDLKIGAGRGKYTLVSDEIKEFLIFNGYEKTLQKMKEEEQSLQSKHEEEKDVDRNPADRDEKESDIPKLYSLFESQTVRQGRQIRLKREMDTLRQQHDGTLTSARAIFTIAISCLQHLHNLKEGQAKTDNLGEAIENYKVDLGKYHKILLTELKKDEKQQLFSESVLQDHKNRVIRAKSENNVENIIEVLLSLRVNALQISPELRRNLVTELIRNDIFLVKQHANSDFVCDLLAFDSSGLKHAVCALISVVASTAQGVDYLLVNSSEPQFAVILKIIDIMNKQTDCTDGSVTQRFCLAILQKMSMREEVVELLFAQNLPIWLLDLLGRATKKNASAPSSRLGQIPSSDGSTGNSIHVFCLDFASALLANILHSYHVMESLEANPALLKDVMNRLLNLLKENIPTSVLVHALICLSYLSKERFQNTLEECMFVDKISDFVGWYSIKHPMDAMGEGASNSAAGSSDIGQVGAKSSTTNAVVDKKTVLDLCAHMFHPKESSHDVSGTMEYNWIKQEEKIKEFENVQGDLIFECFQDEVS